MSDIRRRIVNPYGDRFPDDDSIKEVRLQADGQRRADPAEDRHVCIRWTNGVLEQGGTQALCTQIIHLTGGPGTYAFHTPQVKLQSEVSQETNTFYSLGRFNRAQRDRILVLARNVSFDPKSRVNCCRVWMHDLLEAMLNDGLIQKALFDYLVADVPLKKRVPEM